MTFGVNDYPYSSSDPYGFAPAQCASFVNWRCVHDYDIGAQHNPSGTINGSQFADWIGTHGYLVDGKPRVRDIVSLAPGVQGTGKYGHVAVVIGVGSGGMLVEDYNWRNDFQYLQHTFSDVTGMRFAHVLGGVADVLSPDAKNGISTLISLATLGRTTGDDGARASQIANNGDGINEIVSGLLQSAESRQWLAKINQLKS